MSTVGRSRDTRATTCLGMSRPTEPVSGNSFKVGGGPAGIDDKLVIPRILGASDELVAYSYRILDQCLTLCDAVEEVKRVRHWSDALRACGLYDRFLFLNYEAFSNVTLRK